MGHQGEEDDDVEAIDSKGVPTDVKPPAIKTQTSYVECGEYTPKSVANGHMEKVPVQAFNNPAYASTEDLCTRF